MEDDILNLFGIAQRSGNLVTGEDTCIFYLRKNKINLVIVTEDASSQTKLKFQKI